MNDSPLVKNMPSTADVARETKGNVCSGRWIESNEPNEKVRPTPQAETSSSVFASVTLFLASTGKRPSTFCEAVLAAVVNNRHKYKVQSMWVFCPAVLAGGRNPCQEGSLLQLVKGSGLQHLSSGSASISSGLGLGPLRAFGGGCRALSDNFRV